MADIQDIVVPDIGGFDAVDVIEVLVAVGATVAVDEALATLESDKASMDVPSPFAGVVREVAIKKGDKVKAGSLVARVEVSGAAPAPTPPPPPPVSEAPAPALATSTPASTTVATPEPVEAPPAPHPVDTTFDEEGFSRAYAGPAVRRFARELGVDLAKVSGSARKGRITKDDVAGFVKQTLAAPVASGGAATGGAGIPPIPAIDFAKFGPVTTRALSKIRRASGANLHRAWLNVPHVTQHEQADVTELEAFRKGMGEGLSAEGVKLTFLPFLIRAVVAALKQFPDFNASLSPDGQSLILKQYYHLGVAVDTPEGLMVPVLKNADQKGLKELARDLADLSTRAREGKLKLDELSGGTFSISSLGGIGGTAFTPIVNAPEVAILGVSRTATQPVWQDGAFVPRLMLPLSLSYDHRVIDGAAAARFVTSLAKTLGDIRRLLL